MEATIDANAPLDYIEFHIFPMQNRYEACVTYLHKKEKVSSGLLEHLLQHSARIRELHSKGSNAKYGLSPPEYSHDIKWFTKSTLIRFLHIIGSANILEVTSSLKIEISQLEEARRIHLSMYMKGTKSYRSEELGCGCANGIGPTTKAEESEESDISKNKLLHAIDSRLTALRGELTTAFDQAAGSRYSVEEMTDIEKFSRHFGSLDLSDSLHKHIELRRGAQAVESPCSNHISEHDSGSNEGKNHINEYGTSPEKVAHIERQSSTGSDKSSFPSEEEKQQERSRTLIRFASPRRSASPMRRLQIGRSGSRRSTAITIKSLNHVPARDRSFLPAGAAASDSEEEGSQQEPKKSDSNVRISVQDAINLFERKQRDQKVDIRKSGSFTNASVGANKSVPRRWSSGMGEDSSLRQQDTFDGDHVSESQNDTENTEIKHDSQGPPTKEACSLVVTHEETLPNEPTDAGEKLISSAEWNRQKEAELNELLKMMEPKAIKSWTVPPPSNKRHSLPSEERGGFYDHYKDKRDEKLFGEAAGNREERDKQFKPKQQSLDARKSQVASPNATDAGRKHNVKMIQKLQKRVAEPANGGRTENPKPGPVKKASIRSSSVPHTRKSPSPMPSPRAPSPAKTPPTASAGAMPTRRRPRSATPVSRSNPKVEISQIGTKPVEPSWNNSKKSSRNAAEKKQQSMTKPWQTVKSKVRTTPEDCGSAAKPSLYSKVTKKSSVVPLESKPSLRKSSGTVKKKTSPSPQEVLPNSADPTPNEVDVKDPSPSDPVIHHVEEIGETPVVMENGTTVASPATDDSIMVELQFKPEDEEGTISSAAWVEIKEHENQLTTSEDYTIETVGSSPADIVPAGGSSSPRVHNSLSQMLREESSELDVPYWGNAPNPPQVVEHKDLPKGLKRLLKFARKSKTEEEDDVEDSKFVNPGSAENLLRKAALHSKSNGHGARSFFSLSAFKGSK